MGLSRLKKALDHHRHPHQIDYDHIADFDTFTGDTKRDHCCLSINSRHDLLVKHQWSIRFGHFRSRYTCDIGIDTRFFEHRDLAIKIRSAVILTIRPEGRILSRQRFPGRLICEGETHGFETTCSKGIPQKRRRVGRWFHLGSRSARDRPRHQHRPADDQGRQGSDRLRRPLAFRHLGTHRPRRQAFAR